MVICKNTPFYVQSYTNEKPCFPDFVSYLLLRFLGEGDEANRSDTPLQHGVSNSYEAVITAIRKRMRQKSQAYGTGIPSVWD